MIQSLWWILLLSIKVAVIALKQFIVSFPQSISILYRYFSTLSRFQSARTFDWYVNLSSNRGTIQRNANLNYEVVC